MRKSVWLLSASLMAFPSAAFAQDNQETTEATSPSPTEQAATEPAAQAAADAESADIVVTAQRQAERLQDVPIAVSALTGEALQTQQIQNATQLQLSLPIYQGGLTTSRVSQTV